MASPGSPRPLKPLPAGVVCKSCLMRVGYGSDTLFDVKAGYDSCLKCKELECLRPRNKCMEKRRAEWFNESWSRVMLEEGLMSDVRLITKDGTILNAHRALLASRSIVFKKMLEAEMREGATGTVHIDDMAPQTLRSFVEFLYTAELPTGLTNEEGLALISAAHKYDIPYMQEIVEGALIPLTNAGNVFDTYSVAAACQAVTLMSACTHIAKAQVSDDFIHQQLQERNYSLIFGPELKRSLVLEEPAASSSQTKKRRRRKG